MCYGTTVVKMINWLDPVFCLLHNYTPHAAHHGPVAIVVMFGSSK